MTTMIFLFLLSFVINSMLLFPKSIVADASIDLLSTGTNTRIASSSAGFLSFLSLSEQKEQQKQRYLQFTGDVWQACSTNITEDKRIVSQNSTEYTKSVYRHTTYDDQHNPVCTCFYDKEQSEYWAQCALGDNSCGSTAATSAATSGSTSDSTSTDACLETHEFFLFSDVSGNLKQKSSCKLCTDVNNCNSIGVGTVTEKCTLVVFDEDNKRPLQCVIKGFREDGSQSTCEQCTICRDEMGNYGISYDCFGKTTPPGQCDIDGTAHLHNFQPVIKNNKQLSRGGTFANICPSSSTTTATALEEVFYGTTAYDDDYQKSCDCIHTMGVVACDLFQDSSVGKVDCFANECTDRSELFYFNRDGQMFEKMSCGTTNNLEWCSVVKFWPDDTSTSASSTSPTPISCTIFSPSDLNTCNDCTICQDETTQEYGIRYNCFGLTTNENTCNVDGRAVFNIDTSKLNNQGGTTTSSSSTSTSSNTNNNNIQEKNYGQANTNIRSNNNQTPMIVGIVLGGIALAGILAIIVSKLSQRRKVQRPERPETITAIDVEPPTAVVDNAGQPMVKDPTPITLA